MVLRDSVFADSCLLLEFKLYFREAAICSCAAYIHKIALHDREDVHDLGVAKPCIVFDQLDPISGQHEAAIHYPTEMLIQLLLQGECDLVCDELRILQVFFGKEWEQMVCSRVGAHAASVWTPIAIECALVVLHYGGRQYGPAVGEELDAELLAF